MGSVPGAHPSATSPPPPATRSPPPPPPSPSPLAAPPFPSAVISTADVLAWLAALSLARYAPSFRDNDIDGHTLRTVTSSELRDDLGVLNLFHRRQLLSAISRLPDLPERHPHPRRYASASAATVIPVTQDEHDYDPTAPDKSDDEGNTLWHTLSKRLRTSSSSSSSDSPTRNNNPMSADDRLDRMPEHGRVLDHLSNVRTYHSWLRVGVQFLSFALVSLRLAPDFRYTGLISGMAYYFAAVALFALIYAAYRYRAVIRMIEQSRLSNPQYTPDVFGAVAIVTLLLMSAVLATVVISLPAPPPA